MAMYMVLGHCPEKNMAVISMRLIHFMVLGITQLADIWFKPFIALHYVDQTYYSGNNGYVVGWVAGYDFNLVNQKFSITNWHEMEFDRNKRYGNGGKNGFNGAVAIWWHPTASITTGIQYRYAYKKLGENFLQDGVIYSLKYNF